MLPSLLFTETCVFDCVSNSGGNYNSAAEIVLSALKYGAPNLAVGAHGA